MAALLTQLELENGTDARFRAWGKAISDQMAAGGWVQTTDTGQINWATVTKPVGLVDIRGYEIWRSNDAAGSLLEIFVRFEYGSGAQGVVQPYMNVGVGWGSNGAGVLTSGAFVGGANMTTTGATGLVNCILVVGTGWFAFLLGTTAQKIMFFSLERTRNASYLFQNEVVTLVHANGTVFGQTLIPVKSYPQIAGGNSMLIPITSTWTMFDGTIDLGMYVGWKGYKTNPLINAYGFNAGLLGVDNGKVIVPGYNQNHTYMVAPNVVDARYNNTAGFQHLIRFE